MSKKKDDLLETIGNDIDKQQTFNPLLVALRENDKVNMFKTNITNVYHKTGFHLFDYYFGTVINIHDELGRIIKQEPRIGQSCGTFNLLIGNTGSGKGLPNSTMLPSPNEKGYIKMGDIKVGDKLFGKNGQIVNVIGVYPRGIKNVYKVSFSDGRYTLCDEDHLWEVYSHSHGKLKKQILSVKELIKSYRFYSENKIINDKKHKGENTKSSPYIYKYKVKLLTAPVQYPHQDVPINPYVLGALIGNGCLRENKLTISSGNDFVPQKIAGIYNWKIIKSKFNYNYYFSEWKNPNKYIQTKEFFKDLPEFINSYSREKEIPNIYIYNDEEIRMMLLQGLMDTDGSISFKDGRYTVSYTSTSKKLLEQIIELIRSLGFNGSISIDKRQDKYVNEFCGTIIFQIPNSFKSKLFTLGYKRDLAETALYSIKRTRDYTSTFINNISYSHDEECTCIKVDSKDELFLTDQFIPTHNTTLAAQIAANIIRQFPFANIIHFDCENRFDVSRCETITQLPSSFFDSTIGERYMIRGGTVGLDVIQEMIVKTYVNKMKLKEELMIDSGFKDEFNRPIKIFQPTVIIIDSITTVLSETFNPDSSKEASDAEKMRGNTEGARDAKTLKGFFKDILPLCKEGNIIVYGINHINSNMSMNSFLPVAKQQNFLKQEESIPGGKTMLYYPFNIIKLVAKPGDNFTEESDGFSGHIVMVEPIKSSSNQSGNKSTGVSFDMVFSYKYGFDPLRTMINYGRFKGLIEGNKARYKFKDDSSFTFSWKNINEEKNEKPIWESINKFIVPTLNEHLPFIEPNLTKFDDRSLAY